MIDDEILIKINKNLELVNEELLTNEEVDYLVFIGFSSDIKADIYQVTYDIIVRRNENRESPSKSLEKIVAYALVDDVEIKTTEVKQALVRIPFFCGGF